MFFEIELNYIIEEAYLYKSWLPQLELCCDDILNDMLAK